VQSSSQIITTDKTTPKFSEPGCPSCRPTNSVRALSLSVLTAIFQVDLVIQCLLKQRMTEVVVTTGAIGRAKLQSNHHHQQNSTQVFRGRMPFLSPNQQCQSTEGYHGLAYPKLTWGLPTLSLTNNSS